MDNGKERIPGVRQFMVFTLPHKRDPELKTPVIELDGSTEPPTPIEYDSTEVIEKVVLDLARDRARSAGYNAGAKAVLDVFDFTIEDYLVRRKVKRAAKKALDNTVQPTVGSENGQQG
jgi:hypothetical protein